jgi:hypothetical protein
VPSSAGEIEALPLVGGAAVGAVLVVVADEPVVLVVAGAVVVVVAGAVVLGTSVGPGEMPGTWPALGSEEAAFPDRSSPASTALTMSLDVASKRGLHVVRVS